MWALPNNIKTLDTRHIGITQNNSQHKNSLCDDRCRAVDSIKHCEK